MALDSFIQNIAIPPYVVVFWYSDIVRGLLLDFFALRWFETRIRLSFHAWVFYWAVSGDLATEACVAAWSFVRSQYILWSGSLVSACDFPTKNQIIVWILLNELRI